MGSDPNAGERDETTTNGGQLVAGEHLGPYRIEAQLGAGGMGEVYRAFDTRLHRTVAIKVLLRDNFRDPERKGRFLREARAASALSHPNIVTLHDICNDHEIDFLVLEYVRGQTLNRWVPSKGMSLNKTLEVAVQIANALAAAHAVGIVHRDIKPPNVMVTPERQVKILDFGLAKWPEDRPIDANTQTRTTHVSLTQVGQVMGTVAYMSPEQARGERLDARTDLFSFGAVLYEMATGQAAFPKAWDWTPPPATGVDPSLYKVILKLIQADREQRYESASEVLEDLKGLERRVQSIQDRRRQRLLLASALAAVALAVLAIAATVRLRNAGPPGRDQWIDLTKFPDSVSQPALSADGRMLTFIRGPSTFYGPGQIYVKMLPDGEPKQLTKDGSLKMSPMFSPDGSRIAYTTVDSQFKWDTWTVPVLGGEPRRWLVNAAGLAWRDGRTILFSELRIGNHMSVETAEDSRVGQRPVYIPARPSGMAHRSYPSPDGINVLVAEMDGPWLPCRLVPMDGSSSGQSVGPPGAACTFAAWSPDGKWMYLSSSASGAFHIWRQHFPYGKPEQITSGPTDEEGIAMSPDGRSFITAVGMRQRSVTLHDSSGERQISLEGYAYNVRFTPDGKAICYRILRGSQPNSDPTELWIADLDSGRNEPLLPGFSLLGTKPYEISPDGRRVVVSARDREGKDHLWLAPLDRGSAPYQIPNIEGITPVFGPKGDIVFRGTDGFAYSINEDGGGLRKITEARLSVIYSLSPDHRYFVGGIAGRTLAYPLEGGAAIEINSLDGYSGWSADGRYFHTRLGGFGMGAGALGNTYLLPLARGHVFPDVPPGGFQSEQELANYPGVRVINAGDVALGPTPDVYAFSRETTQRNLYRIPIP
jgi:serine/threonine protein kinase/Tol biopolymer transport system component